MTAGPATSAGAAAPALTASKSTAAGPSQAKSSSSSQNAVPALEAVPGVTRDAQSGAAAEKGAAVANVAQPQLTIDEFESALNAARQLMRKGDFEAAEALFAQCCALLDYHEGEGLHTAYLIVDWAPCLNQVRKLYKFCDDSLTRLFLPHLS